VVVRRRGGKARRGLSRTGAISGGSSLIPDP